MPQLLVRGQQQVESLFGFREQFAIGDLRPFHFKCGDDIVTVKEVSQRHRRALIEENAHVATLWPGSLRQTPGLREPVRGSLPGTTRETDPPWLRPPDSRITPSPARAFCERSRRRSTCRTSVPP